MSAFHVNRQFVTWNVIFHQMKCVKVVNETTSLFPLASHMTPLRGCFDELRSQEVTAGPDYS